MLAFEFELSDVLTCGQCGIRFAFDAHRHEVVKKTGQTFFCPNGHGRVYRETEVKRLKRELEAAKLKAERAHEARRWAEQAAKNERRSHAATKGHLTRTQRRVAHGVCPCCNRTFKQLQAHMKRKHPDYVAEHGGADE